MGEESVLFRPESVPGNRTRVPRLNEALAGMNKFRALTWPGWANDVNAVIKISVNT